MMKTPKTDHHSFNLKASDHTDASVEHDDSTDDLAVLLHLQSMIEAPDETFKQRLLADMQQSTAHRTRMSLRGIIAFVLVQIRGVLQKYRWAYPQLIALVLVCAISYQSLTFMSQTTHVESSSQESGLNPLMDTWTFENAEGKPSFSEFAHDYGIPRVTHVITETSLAHIIKDTPVLDLNLTGITLTLALTVTSEITDTQQAQGRIIPRPIEYLYEEIIYKAVYSDQFHNVIDGTISGGQSAGMIAALSDYGGRNSVRSIRGGIDPIKDTIQRYHGRQISAQVLEWLATSGRFSATQLYDHLHDVLATPAWIQNPELIGLIPAGQIAPATLGYTLLPYKVTQLDSTTARVYVYDPNYVDTTVDTRYLEINLETSTWSYQVAQGFVLTGQELYSVPSDRFHQPPLLPMDTGRVVVGVRNGIKLLASHLQSDGIVSSETIKLNAEASTQLFSINEPITMHMPHDEGATKSDLMFFGTQRLIGVVCDTSPDTYQTIVQVSPSMDEVHIQPINYGERCTIYIFEESNTATSLFQIVDVPIEAGESFVVRRLPGEQRYEVLNPTKTPKIFTIEQAAINTYGVFQHTYHGQQIAPGERKIYSPIFKDELLFMSVESDATNDGLVDRRDILEIL